MVLRTETGAAAQMLTEAEGRLAQMLSDAGLKLGQFDAYSGGQNRGFADRTSNRNKMAWWQRLKMTVIQVTQMQQMG